MNPSEIVWSQTYARPGEWRVTVSIDDCGCAVFTARNGRCVLGPIELAEISAAATRACQEKLIAAAEVIDKMAAEAGTKGAI
jgi:hypothetical protein